MDYRKTLPMDGNNSMGEILASRKDTIPHNTPKTPLLDRDLFWMCYVDGESSPKVKHKTWPEAVREAERLSKLYVGKRVYVLCTMEFQISEIQTERFGVPNG